LKEIDKCVEKFLEEFNQQVQKLSEDDFEKFVSNFCLSYEFSDFELAVKVCLLWKCIRLFHLLALMLASLDQTSELGLYER